ncbi:NrsF family protein [Segnochrobactrum spirostomi]|uniref:DUF1109 domain-containing protein n=1 Tax=Segnochrobactrum spirostomi TaxID=2608987 RepID=A0A6A7Y3P5_9HYPH|nr:NrsF family protein [Segnochrobactrum spirostomi]MQT12721.1 DUF1109 domain-containing protein [Segnochrobactrum spirostomi]
MTRIPAIGRRPAKTDDSHAHDDLIAVLGDDLAPVRPLAPPMTRATRWLAAVAVATVAGAILLDVNILDGAFDGAPELVVTLIGSVLTTVLAALAAFELSMPDRHDRWAALPLPAAALWIGAGGLSCFQLWLVPDADGTVWADVWDCLILVVLFAAPLAALMLVMLKAAPPLRRCMAATVGGLAAAAAASTAVSLFRPFDGATTDLIVHFFVVLAVVVASGVYGALTVTQKKKSPPSKKSFAGV